MTTRRSTLSRDEKAVLAHGRRLGLEVAVAILRREVERQPTAAVRETADRETTTEGQARALVGAPTRSGYLTKGAP